MLGGMLLLTTPHAAFAESRMPNRSHHYNCRAHHAGERQQFGRFKECRR
jgi:hypothetical protein